MTDLFLFEALLVIIIVIFSSPKIKGIIGEKFVSYRLSRLNPEKYKTINDLFFDIDSNTSQIDHLVVSNYGIFVIETKNYKGWIFGSDSSKHWKQIIYKRRESFYNPVWQNNGHIKAIQKVLGEINNYDYISIVVFPAKATFKKLKTKHNVIYSYNLRKTIKKYQNEVLTDEQVGVIYDKLLSVDIVDKKKRKRLMKNHIKSIQAYK